MPDLKAFYSNNCFSTSNLILYPVLFFLWLLSNWNTALLLTKRKAENIFSILYMYMHTCKKQFVLWNYFKNFVDLVLITLYLYLINVASTKTFCLHCTPNSYQKCMYVFVYVYLKTIKVTIAIWNLGHLFVIGLDFIRNLSKETKRTHKHIDINTIT